MRRSQVRTPFWLAFGVITAVVGGLTGYVLSRPYPEMISFMADDAFYYLVPAYAFAHGDGWTLDHVTRTAGFQLLYGYAAAAVSLVTGYSRAFPSTMTLTSAIAVLAGVWLALKQNTAMYGAHIAAAAMLLTLASPRALFQITAGLEWGWVVMMTCGFLWALTRRDVDVPERGGAMIAATAFVAVLTRVDLAIFVAIFTVALMWAAWRKGAPLRSCVRVVSSAAAAAGVAVAMTGLNSWAITGSWTPNSVAMKEFWSRTNAFQPALSWNLLVSCTGPGLALTQLRDAIGLRSFLVMGMFFAGIAAVCKVERQHGAERFAMSIASAAAITIYTAAYARGVNLISDHYSGPIIIPMACLTCAALAMMRRYWPAVAATAGTAAVLASIGMPLPVNAAHRIIATHAGEMFQTLPSYSRVAGWNVGIASWMSGGRVMNLDGLANANVVAPIQSGSLACYLATMDVTHLMDFGYMFPGQIDTGFSGDERARERLHLERNGYDAGQLFKCVSVAAERYDPALPTSTYRLFSVNQPCVATLCRHPKTRIDSN